MEKFPVGEISEYLWEMFLGSSATGTAARFILTLK